MRHRRGRSRRAPGVPDALLAAALAAVLGGVYLAVSPPSADLAAATYRGDLFSRAGLVLWDNGWYGGHHLPAYSLLAPPLTALVGARVLLVLGAVATAALLGALARRTLTPGGARACGLWLALGLSVGLLSGRVPYYLGLAGGAAALVAAVDRRWLLALALALATGPASPIAALFLALVAVAHALAERSDRGGWLALALVALVPVAALAILFPEGGREPFAASAFWPALGGTLVVGAVLGRRRRVIAVGAGLYALASAAAFVAQSPIGGNVARLGALVAGPLAAGVLWRGEPLLARHRCRPGRDAGALRLATVGLAVVALAYWQLVTPVRDLSLVAGDPSVHAAYYAPLLGELGRLSADRPLRVEVPLTRSHWEARFVAARVLLARGWERQLDTRYGGLFYGHRLGAGDYRSWLADNAVAYVALPDVPLDGAGRAEARLIAVGQPFLRPLWRSSHWRLFSVDGALPLAQPPAVLISVGADRLTLRVPRAGWLTVRVRFSPYWAIAAGHGCVARAAGNWTRVRADAPGLVRVKIAFSLARVFDHGPRCR